MSLNTSILFVNIMLVQIYKQFVIVILVASCARLLDLSTVDFCCCTYQREWLPEKPHT